LAGNVNLMGGKISTSRILVGTPEGKERLENLDVCDMILLKWAVKYMGGCGLNSSS
jgi:hypothetical protein